MHFSALVCHLSSLPEEDLEDYIFYKWPYVYMLIESNLYECHQDLMNYDSSVASVTKHLNVWKMS